MTRRQQLQASAAAVPKTGELVRVAVEVLADPVPGRVAVTRYREFDRAWLVGPCDPEGNPILAVE